MYKRKYSVDDKVIINIEDKKFSCSRKNLCENSDYFYVMFHGDFTEKDKKSITIKDIPENGFKNCLNYIDKEIDTLEYDQILETLQCACVLQFAEIKQYCVTKFTEDLRLEYCLDLWHMTEFLDIHPLCEKAKCLALLEFNKIKDMNCVLQINLKQLHLYLANNLIYCDNELDIFQTGMNWWYENSSKLQESENWTETDTNKHLYTILSCVNFKALTKINVNHMLTFHDIHDNKEICNILLGILSLMENSEAKLNEEIEEKAKNLYFNTKSRDREILPCIVTSEYPWQPEQNKRSKTMEREMNISYYDYKTKNMQKLYSNEIEFAAKCNLSLNGCKVIPYKQNIILFGGEHLYGKGDWNSSIWKLRSFQDQWELVTRMPKDRRHFTSCIVGDRLFIIGGTEKYRVRVGTEMLLYDFKEDCWIQNIHLPYSCFDIKVCDYKNQLLVIPAVANNEHGYIFNLETLGWIKLTIQYPPNFKFDFTRNFVLFSKGDTIYLKGSHFLEMKVEGSQFLKVENFKNTPELHGDKYNYFLNNDNLYVFTKHDTMDYDNIYQLHCYNLTTKKNELLVQINDSIDQWWHIKRGCFPFFHHCLTKDLKCISEFSM